MLPRRRPRTMYTKAVKTRLAADQLEDLQRVLQREREHGFEISQEDLIRDTILALIRTSDRLQEENDLAEYAAARQLAEDGHSDHGSATVESLYSPGQLLS